MLYRPDQFPEFIEWAKDFRGHLDEFDAALKSVPSGPEWAAVYGALADDFEFGGATSRPVVRPISFQEIDWEEEQLRDSKLRILKAEHEHKQQRSS